MRPNMLLWPILLPALAAVLAWSVPKGVRWLREAVALLASGGVLALAWTLFKAGNLELRLPWLGDKAAFELRLFHFSGFILLGLAGFLVLIAIYSTVKMKDHPKAPAFYGLVLLSAALANGAVLADNFVPLLFFWEGLLVTLYGLIAVGGPESNRTAVKAFVISGLCDFCLILGVGILWAEAGTLTLSRISVAPQGLGAVAFVMMMIGAVGKAGAMPFHTWIPDAAIDAPVTFMAFMPAAFEKLLGIYLLARITLDLFKLEPGSTMAVVLMVVGAVTIVLAVAMALIQKDFKRLLSYHAVSQVGYMILGIGTAIPIGIAGGLFHMLNHAMYKCGLFLSAGSVEHRTGTTELKKLGGLAREMPLTALGFGVCALAISGVWPLNGFVSKEMVFHGALESGYTVFAAAAWLGAILTFASFLKAGHSVFFGPRSKDVPKVKESPFAIVLPILVLALLCVTFGVANKLPLGSLISPILQGHAEAGESLDFSAHALSLFNPVAGISILCLLAALGLHAYGWKRGGKKAYLASEPVHNAPGLKQLYGWAEKRFFDLYEQGVVFLRGLSQVLYRGIDRPIDFFFERIVTAVGRGFTGILSAAHTGRYANYLAWCVGGLIVLVAVIQALLR